MEHTLTVLNSSNDSHFITWLLHNFNQDKTKCIEIYINEYSNTPINDNVSERLDVLYNRFTDIKIDVKSYINYLKNDNGLISKSHLKMIGLLHHYNEYDKKIFHKLCDQHWSKTK